jgi:peptidyl-prolyl cis-trans isomerase C
MSVLPLFRGAVLGLALGGVALVSGVQAAESAPGGTGTGDPVVARVDGAEIHRSEVTATIATLPAQFKQMPTEVVFPAVIDQMINGRLVAAAAAQQNLQDDPEFKEKIKRAEERVLQELYINRTVKSRITDEALQARYKKYVQDNPPQDEVRASHILVATEAEAKALLEQIKAGGDFAKLAKEKSTDAAAAAQGGDLGWFAKDAMVAPFSEAAFAGTPGQVIDKPVQTQFGWHVIRVDDRRKTPTPTLDEVKGELENELSQEIVGSVVSDLRGKAKIETFNADGSPRTAAPAAPAAH